MDQLAASCKMVGMRVSTSESESALGLRKRSAHSRSGINSYRKWRSSSILEYCSQVSGEWNRRLTDGLTQHQLSVNVNLSVLRVDLCSYCHL